MSLWQAVVYFFKEAARNLVRSWKTSLLAILTISISLFVGGLFLLVSQNLSRQAKAWGEQVLVTVYVNSDARPHDRSSLEELFERPWVQGVSEISVDEAQQRFEEAFPSLSDVFGSAGDAPFSPSFELEIGTADGDDFDVWMEDLQTHEATEMVDDDRDWLLELNRVITFVRGLGLGVGLGLMAAAVLTIASVIKLTAYLYIEEIHVQRLVGATEFFIRGPFYAEGLLQGLLGGMISLVVLYGAAVGMGARTGDSFWLPFVAGDFLPWTLQVLLVLAGALSGLFGAVLSLRRESLDEVSVD